MRFQRVLKMRHLVLLRTLGAELSLRRCAEVLNTSQPAISRTLAELEQQLGTRLFERTTRSMRPTPAGQSLIWHAQRVLSDLDQAEADFHALARGASHVLHLGVLPGFDALLLSRLVHQFMARHPDVEVRLHQGLAPDLFTDLRQDRVHMILSHVDVHRQEVDVVADVLYREDIAVIAAPGHPLQARRALTFGDLSASRWLLPPVGTTVRVAVERELLLAADGPVPPIVETEAPHLIATLVQHAGVLAAVPRSLARWLCGLGVAVQLDLAAELPSWPVCLAYKRQHATSQTQIDFIECVRAATASDHTR